MGQLTLILGNVFDCINENKREQLWQKCKTHNMNILTLNETILTNSW